MQDVNVPPSRWQTTTSPCAPDAPTRISLSVMLQSPGMRSLPQSYALLPLVLPAILGASWEGIGASSRVIAPALSRRDAIGVAIGVDHSTDR